MTIRIATSAMIGLLAALLAVLWTAGVWSNEPGNDGASDPEKERAEQVGHAFNEAEDAPVAQVGAAVITMADYQMSRRLVEVNVEFMEGVIAEGGPPATGFQERLDIIERAGIANVALGGLIVKTALAETARDRGFSPDEDEVAESVAATRELAEKGEAPSVSGFAEVVGERYWAEILPERIRVQQIVDQLRADVRQGIENPEDWAAAWAAMEEQAVTGADIEVIDSAAIEPASVSGAIEYLHSYWGLDYFAGAQSSRPR
ncbi:MAG: hypothetical protein WD208_12890 [Dehalococcoidia bacterium]